MARSHILKGFSDLESALWIHKYHCGLSIKQMVKVAQENGYPVTDTARYEAAQLLDEWGLADKNSRTLTPDGEAFYSLWETKRSAAIDFLHGRQYSLWTQKYPDENLASWAYKMVCDYLWERQALPEKSDLLAYIADLRAEHEAHIPPDIGEAFSAKSINSGYDWLLPLDPPVLEGVEIGSHGNSYKSATFQRRSFCSTALFATALGYVVRETGSAFGELIKIDEVRKQAICRFCLINETGFDLMLDDTLRKVPYLSVQKGVEIYMVIDREPKCADFLD